MSAFIVSETHICALVEPELSQRPDVAMIPSDIGQMLWAENHKSVWFLYQRLENLPQFTYQRGLDLSSVVRLKLLQSYEYQSCEHPEWKTSEAFAYCQILRLHLINQLPGYAGAPWSI